MKASTQGGNLGSQINMTSNAYSCRTLRNYKTQHIDKNPENHKSNKTQIIENPHPYQNVKQLEKFKNSIRALYTFLF